MLLNCINNNQLDVILIEQDLKASTNNVIVLKLYVTKTNRK